MSKTHPQQNVINEKVERPDPAAAALAQFATTQIADSGAPVGVVSPRISRHPHLTRAAAHRPCVRGHSCVPRAWRRTARRPRLPAVR